MNTGDTPHILILQVRTVGIFEYLQGQTVGSCLQIRRDTEGGGLHTTLTVSYLLTVYPYVESTAHRSKTQVYLLSVPAVGNRECPAIASCGITLHVSGIGLLRFSHHVGRIDLEGIATTAVDRGAITVHLPVARHLEIIPLTVIVRRKIELARLLLRCLCPPELPHAIQ